MSEGMDAFPAIPEDNRILYFGRDRAAFRLFSHFHPAPIEIDGARWPTVEHFYQAAPSPRRRTRPRPRISRPVRTRRKRGSGKAPGSFSTKSCRGRTGRT
jgi:predicted NAD-dependent protein-ADP-ribosyltransferase YbiA (DUF1768 family)